MPTGLTLQQTDDTCLRSGERRYTWHRGSIQPYSSLWLIVLRFALLNRPKPSVLFEDLRGGKTNERMTGLRLDGRGCWPDHEFIDLRGLSKKLREPLEAFRYSSIGDFPAGFHELFLPSLAICPVCMAEAFHTILFSLRGIVECPVHKVRLLRECARCGKVFKNRVLPFGIYAPICACRESLLDEVMARRPPRNLGRDQELAHLVECIEDKGRRYWVFVPDGYSNGLDFDALKHHLRMWADEAGEPYPPWLEGDFGGRQKQGDRFRCIERSGVRLVDTVRKAHSGNSLKAVEWRRNSLPERRPRTIFKCIRRYLIRHVLGGDIRLLSEMDSFDREADWPRPRREDIVRFGAISFLLWSQSSYWGESEWDWLRRTIGSIEKPAGFKPCRHRVGELKAPARNVGNVWVSDWLFASEFLDLWPSESDVLALYDNDVQLLASFRRIQRQPLEWWAWKGEDGGLRLGIYRRMPVWTVAPRRGKDVRCKEYEERLADKRCRLTQSRDLVSKPAFELDGDGGLRAMGQLLIDADAPVKVTKLVMSGYKGLHAVIAPRQVCHGGNAWILRCVEIPVRQQACNIALGMTLLKAAVRAYLRSSYRSDCRASSGGLDCSGGRPLNAD
ncbi:hypothetical protein IWX58_004153 [Rubrivivax gelatinosus]|nr:hypothetical protein [Rubrivivax gelatinosus]